MYTVLTFPIQLELRTAPNETLLTTERYLVTFPVQSNLLFALEPFRKKARLAYDELVGQWIFRFINTTTTMCDELRKKFPARANTTVSFHMDGKISAREVAVQNERDTDIVIQPYDHKGN